MDSKTTAITFVFRRPRFPLICDLDGDLFAAASPAALQRLLAGRELPDDSKIRFCDANGESWMFLPNEKILAPGFVVRKWRKVEVIRLFNARRNASEMGVRYPEYGLANRRLDTIVRDISALLSQEMRIEKSRARKGKRENGTD